VWFELVLNAVILLLAWWALFLVVVHWLKVLSRH
jgi:hypothetical protein